MVQVPIAKIGSHVEVDFDSMPTAAKDYIIGYGLKQVLNDCHSSYRLVKDGEEPEGTVFATQEELNDAVLEVVMAKADALEAGEINMRGNGTRAPVDPVGKEAYRLAQQKVRAMIKASKHSLRDLPKGKLAELTAQHLEKNRDHYMELAKANVEAVKEIDINIDLESLVA